MKMSAAMLRRNQQGLGRHFVAHATTTTQRPVSTCLSSASLPFSSSPHPSFSCQEGILKKFSYNNSIGSHPRYYSTTTPVVASTSPFSNPAPENDNNEDSVTPKPRPKKKKSFIPRKAAVTLTERARKFFKQLLEANPEKVGIWLDYHQASSGEPRMVFSFRFVNNANEISLENGDEGVSLEVVQDKNGAMVPKSPKDSRDDGLPKLYVHRNAFLKVLGATVDVDMENIVPILTDPEGNKLDPNA